MDLIVERTDDISTVYAIAETAKEYFESGFENLKKDLMNDKVFAVFTDGKMIGFAAFKEGNSDVIEINWLAVLPDFRDKGIGTLLVNEALREMSSSYKICKVKTLAETSKDKAFERTRNFYKKLGFVSLEIIQPYPGWSDDNPCQIFVKPLK